MREDGMNVDSKRVKQGGRTSLGKLLVLFFVVMLALGGVLIKPGVTTRAAAILTITPITWNVIGLDSTDVSLGPNIYPVGVRVCNTGDTPATGVVSTFVWDSLNPDINVSQPTILTLSTLVVGDCTDFYYNVVVTRDPIAGIGSSREYHITATADGLGEVSTQSGRELIVESLDLTTAINVGVINGPTTVEVGQTYTYTVQSSSPNLEQLENFIDFPNNIFRIREVASTYTTPANATNDKLYADACGWDNDPLSSNYELCVGPANFTGGQVGGTVVTTYKVDVLSTGVITLTNTLYGYSEAANNFEYQTSTSADQLVVTAINANTLTPSPTVTGTPPTSTVTGTPNTSTPTVTGTPPTLTPTPTRTVTGTPPTPTVTGTVKPSPAISISITPSQAKLNGTFTLTIQAANNGTAPAVNTNIYTTSFATYFGVTPSTTRGTASFSTSDRRVTVVVGTLNPGDSVKVTITLRVNSTATTNVTLSTYATVYGSYGSVTYTINSSSVTYVVQATSTLPGTGGLPDEPPPAGLYWPLILGAALLVVMGLAALGYSTWAKSHNPEWATWSLSTGLILCGVAVAFGLAAWGLNAYTAAQYRSLASIPGEASPTASPAGRFIPQDVGDTWLPGDATPEPETLPDYPIPTPTIQITPGPQDSQPDISPANRIVIPNLNLDTVVKYVPYDGLTWLIGGLKQEVAWMGNTSWPGLGSNTALAGHVTLRSGGDGPFRNLADLMVGDEVMIYTDQNIYTYRVREKQAVDSEDLSVVKPSNDPQITLITCTDWDLKQKIYLKRLIVYADQVEVKPLQISQRGN
jgi:LPXTG-site transpeptidase (sortase) family protein